MLAATLPLGFLGTMEQQHSVTPGAPQGTLSYQLFAVA